MDAPESNPIFPCGLLLILAASFCATPTLLVAAFRVVVTLLLPAVRDRALDVRDLAFNLLLVLTVRFKLLMLIDEQSDRLVDRGTEVHRLG